MKRRSVLLLAAIACAGCELLIGYEETAEYAGGTGGADAGADVTAGGTSGGGTAGGGAGQGGAGQGGAGQGGAGQGGAGQGGAGEGGAGEGGGAGSAGSGGTMCGGEPCGPESCTQGSCGPRECWNGSLCVARRVRIMPGIWIDETEVTRSQYAAWTATNPSVSAPPGCPWNVDIQPDAGCIADSRVCQGSGCGQHPQVCVDFCDAHAYCSSIGKSLCGRIGGGSVPWNDCLDAALNAWHHACTSGGIHDYPYGDTYDALACNGFENLDTGCGQGLCSTSQVASLPGCASHVDGYEGVFDLSGNVYEWQLSCNLSTGPSDYCRARGGSFLVNDVLLACGCEGFQRSTTNVNLGFRCCSP